MLCRLRSSTCLCLGLGGHLPIKRVNLPNAFCAAGGGVGVVADDGNGPTGATASGTPTGCTISRELIRDDLATSCCVNAAMDCAFENSVDFLDAEAVRACWNSPSSSSGGGDAVGTGCCDLKSNRTDGSKCVERRRMFQSKLAS
ncbi:hypothetical protein H310_02697 [Aphanomyces invadans]|uniref:Uncharacterized protein n=1 Tax=Aphanomyces invadans TaxID=157072 RepID=A0A024UJ50_9STRA|nr:hypothetical protein H310_02697 [Aphanomyces invadans]ETW06441.1 hypothetical protein H310_02697 [Aphanomyces invadans]|eukprot:XP_008864516.1 hypothetical protein H310_02697 [Aphanomyces invadans]